jgi:hypothetical protein
MGTMGSEVFVDVTYRGLELGRRLKLREVGPSTAYLEHGTPMPVGSQVVLATDEGLSIPVTVVRVHEQVAGAEMPPGMRVQASGLEGAAAGWWRDLVSREDPQIPELEVTPMQRARPLEPRPMAPPPAAEPAPVVEPVVEMEAGDPPESAESPESPQSDDERPTTIMTAVAPPEVAEPSESAAAPNGNGRHDHGAGRTTVMSAQEIRDALGTDPSASAPTASDDDEAAASSSGNGESGAEERGRGKGRGRRRRRR